MQGTSYPIHVVNRLVQSTTSWDAYTAKDWVFIALAVGVLLAYEGFYLAVYHIAPHRCTLHRNILCRRRWVEGTMRKKGSEVLVVQSFRNGILASTFFAGASSTITLFLLGQLTTVSGVGSAQMWAVCTLLFLSFLNFVICIRNYNHMTFQIYNDLDDADFEANPQLKADALRHSSTLMSRATVHHTLGVRCFYLIIVIIGWKISTTGMIGASLLLVPWLAYHDFV